MVIATRCPHCRTVFRVADETLGLASGMVRCGHCNTVFDGARERLAEAAAAAGTVAAAPVARPVTPAAPTGLPSAANAGRTVPPAAPGAAPSAVPLPDAERISATPPASGAPSPFSDAPREPRREPSFAAPPPASAQRHERQENAKPRRAGRLIGGLILALLLLILLAGQLAWWQRERVMVYWPQSQSWFTAFCDRLGCTLTPARWIDGLQLETSSLRQVDGPHRLELRMVLHNRAQTPLAYPTLELTLLDKDNKVLIRRIEAPADYLPQTIPAASGIAAGMRRPVAMRLDTGEAVAANYRVVIFYP
jgi:predicted Zn finger-like uncharacterized protein